jgi:hypothetical protein
MSRAQNLYARPFPILMNLEPVQTLGNHNDGMNDNNCTMTADTAAASAAWPSD